MINFKQINSVQHSFSETSFLARKKALALLQELSPVNFSVPFALDWRYSF
jgi:hypothetical protein